MPNSGEEKEEDAKSKNNNIFYFSNKDTSCRKERCECPVESREKARLHKLPVLKHSGAELEVV